jgi:hypothetical protein
LRQVPYNLPRMWPPICPHLIKLINLGNHKIFPSNTRTWWIRESRWATRDKLVDHLGFASGWHASESTNALTWFDPCLCFGLGSCLAFYWIDKMLIWTILNYSKQVLITLLHCSFINLKLIEADPETLRVV